MKIVWLNWKDRKNPAAGGAELVNEELAKRLAADGHEVVFLTAGYPGGAKEEKRDGFKIIRLGNRWTVYWRAWRYYKKNLSAWPDLIIDEVNTIPFFAKFYCKSSCDKISICPPDKGGEGGSVNNSEKPVKQPKKILFIHQLCRKIWFYQMFFPLNLIGYLLEPLYLRLLNDQKVITVSESTQRDLMRFGFKEENISIISEGIELEPLKDLDGVKKFDQPTVLSLGAVRPMKRTADVVKAFLIAKERIADLELIVAGSTAGKYGQAVVRLANESKFKDSIKFLGRISDEEKIELLRRAHVLCAASVKEGWGLVVTEAASQGTPAIVYDADGLRDSVRANVTGLVCRENTPEAMAGEMVVLLGNEFIYEGLRSYGWKGSWGVNFEKCYRGFLNIILNKI